MNYSLVIRERDLDVFERSLLDRFEKARQPVQDSMAEKFFEIVRMNFGDFGVDRPIEWAPLSPAYAKRVKRAHATLFVSGKLEGSVKTESQEDFSRVYVSKDDTVYALAHQYGVPEKNLPPRPYFPISASGEVSLFSQVQVQEVAREEVRRLIGDGIL